jgi:hypothetical protein
VNTKSRSYKETGWLRNSFVIRYRNFLPSETLSKLINLIPGKTPERKGAVFYKINLLKAETHLCHLRDVKINIF